MSRDTDKHVKQTELQQTRGAWELDEISFKSQLSPTSWVNFDWVLGFLTYETEIIMLSLQSYKVDSTE